MRPHHTPNQFSQMKTSKIQPSLTYIKEFNELADVTHEYLRNYEQKIVKIKPGELNHALNHKVNCQTDYSLWIVETGFASILSAISLCRKYNVGYTFLIDEFGRIYEGHPFFVSQKRITIALVGKASKAVLSDNLLVLEDQGGRQAQSLHFLLQWLQTNPPESLLSTGH